jgi:thiol-disulfide isomerase/thioredoxin
VLVDFWEYTCVNCLRTLPYLKAWYDRYHNDGLVIVGVHANEFEFSGDRGNIESATRRLGISWPVVLDNNFAIWKRYTNNGWPHEYLFDQSGRLVDSVDGEGHYPETESKIQSLLLAQNSKLSLPPVMQLLPQDSYDKPGAMCYLHTLEVLLERVPFANAGASQNPSREAAYVDDGSPRKDGAIYVQGEWHKTKEAAVADAPSAQLTMRYHSIQVVGVLAPEGGKSERVDVTQDGAPIAKADAGSDIQYAADGTSYVTVDSPRAYDLVMNAKFAYHDLRLTSEAPGLGVYSFAFESCEAPK